MNQSGCLGVGLGLLFVALLALMVIPGKMARLEYAKADRIEAQVALEDAKSDRESARSDEWQETFMLWSVALAAGGPDLALVLAVCGLGVAGGFLLRDMRKENKEL